MVTLAKEIALQGSRKKEGGGGGREKEREGRGRREEGKRRRRGKEGGGGRREERKGGLVAALFKSFSLLLYKLYPESMSAGLKAIGHFLTHGAVCYEELLTLQNHSAASQSRT